MKCPECGSAAIVRIGFIVTREGKKQRHKCNSCGRTFYAANLESHSYKTGLKKLEN